MKRLVWLSLLLASACSKTPTAPTPPAPVVVVTPPAPVPQTFTLAGTLQSTNGGSIGSVSVVVGGVTATVVGNTFTATLPAAQTATVTVSGGNVITRTVRAAVPGSVVVDVFGAGFDLDYYRQLARSAKDGHNYALSHWTQPPRIYFQTVDDRGVAVPDSLITETAAVIENIAGEMTGKFGLAGIDRGSDTRESVRGWITVKWLSAPATTSCGDALVGVEQGGVIRLYYRTPACMCASLIRHETGHALGFWHAGGRLDIMNGDTLASCTATISAREREYMHYIYSRKVGNVDPDSDP